MAHKRQHRVQGALEAVRGTAETTITADFSVREGDFSPTITAANGQIIENSKFPYIADQVPVGVTAALAMEQWANVATIRDAVLMASKRTSGALPAFTLLDDQYGVGVARFIGCACSAMNLSMSRSGAPGESDVLRVTHNFECFKTETGSINGGLSAGSGRSFQFRHSTFSVNGVAATEALNFSWALANELALGPVDSSNKRLYITDGAQTDTIELTARFATTAWRALIEAQTEHAVAIVLGTGTANETVTLTIGKCQITARQVADDGGTVTQQITIIPHHTGSAAPVAVTFGSSIGASVIGL